jgi:hypothetical protein
MRSDAQQRIDELPEDVAPPGRVAPLHRKQSKALASFSAAPIVLRRVRVSVCALRCAALRIADSIGGRYSALTRDAQAQVKPTKTNRLTLSSESFEMRMGM